jgi:MoxR-like ATPase
MIKIIARRNSGEWFLEPQESDSSRYSLGLLKNSKLSMSRELLNKLSSISTARATLETTEEQIREVSGKNTSISFFVKTNNYEIIDANITKIEESEVVATKDVFSEIKSNPLYRCPDPTDDGWYVDPDVWDFLMASLITKQHILLRGDTGSGKTELVRFIADRFKKDLTIIDMSILDGRTTLCGSTKLINGNTEIKRAKFADELEKPSFILLDELSRADAMANNVLLPVLDSRRELHMEELGDIENVKRNDDCVIWATANVGIEYTGTGNIDEAISNRFTQVILNYAPIDYETEILMSRTHIPRKEAKYLAGMADVSRSNPTITHPVSTRQLLNIAEYVAMGFDVMTATRQCLGAIYSGRGDNSLEMLISHLK